jgi:hypothetical protein
MFDQRIGELAFERRLDPRAARRVSEASTRKEAQHRQKALAEREGFEPPGA